MKTIHANVIVNISVEFDETKTTPEKVLRHIAESCNYEVSYHNTSTQAKITRTELSDVKAD